MTSLTNPNAQKRRSKQAKEDAEIERDIVTTLMRTGRGRRYVYLRLFHSGIWNEDLSLDSMRLAQKSGLRNEGLRLLSLIHEHCPEHYAAMWLESNRAKREAAKADETEENDDGQPDES